MIIIESMGKISLVLLSLSLVIGSIVLPTSIANYRAMPFAYAQSTNAAMLTAYGAAANSIVANNAADRKSVV